MSLGIMRGWWRIGFEASEIGVVERGKSNRYVKRFRGYFLAAARASNT